VLHTRPYLHATITRRQNGRSLGNFQKALDRKYFHFSFFLIHILSGVWFFLMSARMLTVFFVQRFIKLCLLDVLALLRCYAGSIGIQLPMIQDNLSEPKRCVTSYKSG
jgi:hypothetical protein